MAYFSNTDKIIAFGKDMARTALLGGAAGRAVKGAGEALKAGSRMGNAMSQNTMRKGISGKPPTGATTGAFIKAKAQMKGGGK